MSATANSVHTALPAAVAVAKSHRVQPGLVEGLIDPDVIGCLAERLAKQPPVLPGERGDFEIARGDIV